MVFRRPPFWKFDAVDPTSSWLMRSCMKGQKWKFPKVGTTVHDNISKFWSWDRFPVCIHGSREHCTTCIMEQVTSEVADLLFSQVALGLSFCKHEWMRKLPNLPVQLWRQCFIEPWIPIAVFLIIAIARHVGSCQLTVVGGFRRFHFGWSFLFQQITKVWCLQCGQIF